MSSSPAPECCPACAVDPTAAPGRYCAPLRCLCGHDDCPAAGWVPPRPPDPPLLADEPTSELGRRLREQALAAAARTDDSRLRDAWENRDPDTWIDHL